ncbi:inverse autotransporter beta domain-containing protein [Escherichia fergusonii]|uniref:inverse autotransporter beta domain-containing protein n=1 Tax=Escherichia fergusonii TaxID=564 RepID=UPI0015E910E8|nr:inverse autotransporter beta domain-containing protein [Escherichia fergusonii]QMA56810.1 inverse autotransporter beta domain-containing protein [Escherichia fergusonii]QMA79329.1 inverse autotransporter beta domain-containing protein [Escherichia fergusonii]QMA92750.1 inverse autotransporter beta domain-containing protein [Escherichia fergusonii]QMO22610.1 inverse autotransporter beta domain-containing protein [Escherichia fergusonii]QMO60381.1 inverse autotransporter beta domain-containin
MNENTFRHRPLTRAVAFLCIATPVAFPVAATATGTFRVTAPVADTTTAATADEDARLAGLASQAGSMLTSGVSGDQAADMARGYATGAAQAAFQEWLSQWGTARVTLSADEHFTLKGSVLDLLLPWYDTPENIIFTQHSIHRTDDRNQLNTGAGWRHFMPDYMTGVNLFFDHDLTRYHSRLGLGGEYWRDYLKLGANGYLRLTGWRDAPELDNDYEARPANGWDVRAEGYLPAYPQLGAKLMYEQYYGDEVALFGRDHRQKDPHAFTAGLSYTPVPLVSLSAEQRQGKGGENDTRFGLNLSYTPGVSLARQLDPDAVAYRRSLSGSRHDLVERNNNIVLEYRKKELVKLQLNDPVTGKGGEQKALVASLQSKYALKTLQTDAATLTAAGGVISTTDSQVTVTLPEYRYTATPDTDNTYRVAVTAEDVKGNHSNREESTVVVQVPQLSTEDSEVTSDKPMLKPDGVDTARLTFLARDTDGKAVSGLKVTAGFTAPEGLNFSLSEFFTETSTPGEYTAELSGSTPGEVSVMPQVEGKDAATVPVTVILSKTVPVIQYSDITLSAGTVRETLAATAQTFRAGDPVRVTVTLKDERQQPVGNQKTVLYSDAVTVSGMTEADGAEWQEEDGGVYRKMYIARNAADTHQARLTLGGKNKFTEKYSVLPGALSVSNSSVTTGKKQITADGTDTAVLKYEARDIYGNAVGGLTVTAVNLNNDVTVSVPVFVETGEIGVYTTTLTGTTTGIARIMPQVNGENGVNEAVEVELKAQLPDREYSEFGMNSSDYKTGDIMTLTATLKDKNQKAVSGMADTLNKAGVVNVPNTSLDIAWAETGTPGEYTATYTAGAAQAGLKATLMLEWTKEVTYSISVGEKNMTGEISAGSFTFSTSEKFPTTAFKGATFTLKANNFQDDVSKYDLKVTCGSDTDSCAEVSVRKKDGEAIVTFGTDLPSSARRVKITATPNQGSNATTLLKYEFEVHNWFIWAGINHNYTSAVATCNQDGSLPTRPELIDGNTMYLGRTGSLLGEWGGLPADSLTEGTPLIWAAEDSSYSTYARFPVGLLIVGDDGKFYWSLRWKVEYDALADLGNVYCVRQ